MSQSLDKKTKVRKAQLGLSRTALVYCIIFALLAITAGFFLGRTMAWLQWFVYRSIDTASYLSIGDITVLLIVIAVCIIDIVCVFGFLFSKLSQEIKEKHDQCWIIFAATSALFFVIMGIYINNKYYIVLGITSLVILILIALYTKNILKVLFIACVLTCMLICSAIIKANNIKRIHHTRASLNYLEKEHGLKITSSSKFIT